MTIAISSFVAALLLALALVPILSRWAAAPLGLLDIPDDNRKLHKRPIPLVGGIAVFISVALTAGIYYVLAKTGWEWAQLRIKPVDGSQFLGLFLGAGFLLLVGVVDDSIGLRGRQKLLGQILAVGILIAFGFDFEKMSIWDASIEFGTFSIVMVFLWCLAVINSINLLDGADGFAATIGIIMCVALGIMAVLHPQGRDMDAVVILALAGALLGFLRFNFPPAKVFLGDAGSMLIGFVLAAISIRCTLKQATTYAFFAPIALLAIPFIDTTAAIIRRKLTGRSIYSVDRGHLHHSLSKRGFGPRTSLLWVALLCSATAAGGVLSFVMREPEYALVSIVVVMMVMIVGRLFGVAEVELVSEKVVSVGRSMFRRQTNSRTDNIHQSCVQLQGYRDWNDIWLELCDFSDSHELNQIILDLNMPWIHESFHGKRRRTDVKPAENDEWYGQIPLVVDGKIFGRVEFVASKMCRFSHHDIIANLLKLISDIEPNLLAKAESESVGVPESPAGPVAVGSEIAQAN